MSAQLSGRIALVTGSTNGIGVSMALALAGAGAFVVVTGREEAAGHEVVATITREGGAAAFVAADLSQGGVAVRALVAGAVKAAGGPIDILVNNAAMLMKPTTAGRSMRRSSMPLSL